MVAFLEKHVESKGFEQIIDFLNASSIRYALTVNPTIYVSCIDQFWTTAQVKKVNGVAEIHALIDRKQIVVSKTTIRSALQFGDEGGMECLPKSTIFEEIARIGAKTTAWNEFSSTVASTIIRLATNLNFNFSKFILEEKMSTLAEYMILSGADNRPPMLDKALYDSWKSRMELYMKNHENGRMILESVEHDLLIWPTIEENGLPPNVYALVNHHRVAKDLWARVQMLMQGTSLTKQERECKLYDEFDKFAHVKGESLHSYYLSKFVMDVKLVRDLHTTNFDQLQANLQSHEMYDNEVHLLRERHQDPLALQQVSSSQYGAVHPLQQYSTTYPSSLAISYPPVQHSSLAVPMFNKGDGPIDAINKMMSFLVNTAGLGGWNSSQHRVVKCFNYQGEVEAQGMGKVLSEEELEFLINPGILEGPVTQSVVTQNAAYQADDLDAYDSDCDDITTAKVSLMANFYCYSSDVAIL
ncbi:hypothetical protein Tco_0701692 [Tanacetum coccineum]